MRVAIACLLVMEAPAVLRLPKHRVRQRSCNRKGAFCPLRACANWCAPSICAAHAARCFRGGPVLHARLGLSKSLLHFREACPPQQGQMACSQLSRAQQQWCSSSSSMRSTCGARGAPRATALLPQRQTLGAALGTRRCSGRSATVVVRAEGNRDGLARTVDTMLKVSGSSLPRRARALPPGKSAEALGLLCSAARHSTPLGQRRTSAGAEPPRRRCAFAVHASSVLRGELHTGTSASSAEPCPPSLARAHRHAAPQLGARQWHAPDRRSGPSGRPKAASRPRAYLHGRDSPSARAPTAPPPAVLCGRFLSCAQRYDFVSTGMGALCVTGWFWSHGQPPLEALSIAACSTIVALVSQATSASVQHHAAAGCGGLQRGSSHCLRARARFRPGGRHAGRERARVQQQVERWWNLASAGWLA